MFQSFSVLEATQVNPHHHTNSVCFKGTRFSVNLIAVLNSTSMFLVPEQETASLILTVLFINVVTEIQTHCEEDNIE